MLFYDDSISSVCFSRKQAQLPKYIKFYDKDLDKEYKSYIVNFNLKTLYENKRKFTLSTLNIFLHEKELIKNYSSLNVYSSFLREKLHYRNKYFYKNIVQVKIDDQLYEFCLN